MHRTRREVIAKLLAVASAVSLPKGAASEIALPDSEQIWKSVLARYQSLAHYADRCVASSVWLGQQLRCMSTTEYHKDERFIYEIGTHSGFRRAFSFDRGQARERLRSGEWQEVGSGRLLIAGLYGASLPFGGAGWWPMSLLVGDLNPDYPSLQRFSPSSALEMPTVDGTLAIRLTGKLRSSDATVDVRQSDHAILGVKVVSAEPLGGGKAEYLPLFDSCVGSSSAQASSGCT